jgi:RNA-binding protein PNO1
VASEHRIVQVPPHRLTPLKQHWLSLYTPIVEMLKLDIRCAARRRAQTVLVLGFVRQIH